jgi:hypothetical protein
MKAGKRLIQKVILMTILSLLVLLGSAQSNLLYYNSNDQFNAPAINPAFLSSQHKFTFSIFPLSGMSVGYNNQEVVKGMLLDFVSGNLTQEKMNAIFKSLIEKDLFMQRFETSLFNFGYHSEIGAFNFRINEIEQIRSGLKNDFTQFITNPEFLTIQLNQPRNLYADGVHYREYSLGYAREMLNHKLSVGLRAKIYFGKASLYTEAPGVGTAQNGRYFLETSEPINTSFPVDFVFSEDSIISGANPSEGFTALKYLFNRKNSGMGIDLGITYNVSQKLQLSASVVDLGRINWTSNLNRLNLKGKYEILPQYIKDSGANYVTKDPSFSTDTKEDLNQLFKSVIDIADYSTNLPTSFYAGGQYSVNTKLKIGFVDRFVQSKGMSQNSFSLTANYEVNKKLSLISGYSAIGKSINNIPFALIYNWASGQSFLGTDNLLAFFVPSNADYAGISFGTCFYIFKPKVKFSQSDYLPFYKEKKHNIFNK